MKIDADLGGWGDAFSPQGFDPLPTKRVPLCTIMRYKFLTDRPYNFSKSALASIYTNFKGGGGAKTRYFWSKFFKKCLNKNACFCLFFFYSKNKRSPNSYIFSPYLPSSFSAWSSRSCRVSLKLLFQAKQTRNWASPTYSMPLASTLPPNRSMKLHSFSYV